MSIRRFLFFIMILPAHLFAQEITLNSVYLIPPVCEAHQITIQGELGGEGIVILDSNVCGLNKFGDTTICTQMYPPRVDVRMTQLRIADPKGLGRSMYRLDGQFPQSQNEYFLITSLEEGGLFRLVIADKYSESKQVVALEKRLHDSNTYCK